MGSVIENRHRRNVTLAVTLFRLLVISGICSVGVAQVSTTTQAVTMRLASTTQVVDLCQSSPCLNGGTCTSRNGTDPCDCIDGYVGVHCELVVDACKSSPCLNGRNCILYGSGYTCMELRSTVADTTPPVIQSCPSNIIQELPLGVQSTTVTWQQPSATDNSGQTPSITSSHTSGSTFLVGSTTVTYTFTDQASNFITCQFVVTVTAEIDECLSSPCANDAICVDKLNAFECLCSQETTGLLCDYLNPFEGCPESISVALPPGETHAYVTWAKPRLRAPFSRELVIAPYTVGSSFAVGRHNVEYLYTSTSHVQDCAFNVTVTGNTEPFVQMSCPRGFQVDLPSGQITAYVTWSEPQVIGANDSHVVRVFDSQNSSVKPGTLLSIGNHTFTYKLWQNVSICSFKVGVTGSKNEGTQSDDNFYCSSTESIVVGCVLLCVAILAAATFGLMYIRTKRKLSRAGSRSMVPLDTVSPIPKTINNISNELSRYKTNTKQLPPVPPPKPGLVPEDNAYEALDNYGYLCLELQQNNRDGYQLPRAVYEIPKRPNEY